jgi:hypothetical protein
MIVDPIHAARAEAERLCAQNLEVLKHQAELDVLQGLMPEAPRWSEWHRRPTVELWQAVTLALNVEPIALKAVFAFGPSPCKEELEYWEKVLAVGPPKKSRFEAFAPVQVERREVLTLPRRGWMERRPRFKEALALAIQWLRQPGGIEPAGEAAADVGTTPVRLADFTTWATRQGWKLPAAMVLPAAIAVGPVDVKPASETKEDRDDRRHDEFLAAGGLVVRDGGKWQLGGPMGILAKLAKAEKAAGRPYKDPSDVRRSIYRSAERRRSGAAMTGPLGR